MEVEIMESTDDTDLMSISDGNNSDSVDTLSDDDDFSQLREEALSLMTTDVPSKSTDEFLNDTTLPDDFIKRYNDLMEPKTLGDIVAVSDSSSEEEIEAHDGEPMCTVPMCSSRNKVKVRSRLVTSFYGLTYMESPVICQKCFVKAAKFYLKVAKITPEKNKLLVNENLNKMTEFIDICDDGPSKPGEGVKIEGEAVEEFCRNISIHVDNVAKRFNMEQKYNNVLSKLDSKIGKITVWLNELNCKINMDDKDMVRTLQFIYESYEPNKPIRLDPADLGICDPDCPNSTNLLAQETNPSTIVIDHNPDPDIAIIEVENNKSEQGMCKPSNLPPRGLITRNKPLVGHNIFVTSNKEDSRNWTPAVIESIKVNESDDKFNYIYKVKVTEGSSAYLKDVSEEDMAYFDVSPVRIAVGNRVISVVHSDSGERVYRSGVVAESPSSNNNYRYLIFFDWTSSVQYSSHADLRITCKMKDNIDEYFPIESRPFIRKYFDMLPTRKILTANTMDIIKVAYKGKWTDAKVTAVDGLLLEVFYSKAEPTEWLYRGSPRVMSRDMYRARLYKAFSENSTPGPRCGVTAVDDPVEVEKIKQILKNKQAKMQSPSVDTTVRSVAKKSTTKLPDYLPSQSNTRSTSIYQSKGGKDEFAGYIKTIKDISGMFIPKDLGSHKCSEGCSWTQTTMDSTRGKNPLIIPMLFAFKRVDVTPMGGAARQIYYVSPCGIKLEDFDQLLAYLQATNSPLSVDYFNFDPWVNVWDEFIAAPEGLVLKDLSYGKELNSIRVVNTVDRDLPPYMNYMVTRKATSGVALNLDTDYLTCCDCKDDCSNKAKCPCWQRTVKDYLDLIVKPNTESDSNTNVMDYSYIGYQNKRLVEYVPSGIYECNSKCSCKHTCLNRVVQEPLKVKLELFKTRYKGWGTRCLNDIPAGGFICVYVGNILTEKAANEGGKTYGDEYFAELDYIEVMERLMNKPGYESGPSDPEATDGEDDGCNVTAGGIKLRSRKDKKTRLKRSTTDHSKLKASDDTHGVSEGQSTQEETEQDNHNDYIPLRHLYGNKEAVYIIDAKSAGNIGRYFNHSCEPNIFVQNVFVDTHDLRFPWVAFFAKHHIRAGSELTWDYQYIVDSVPGKKLYCYCSSKNCRGRLL